MTTNFPIYSHPIRAKVVMLKGIDGEPPTVDITKNDGIITITITTPNAGQPTTQEVTMTVPVVEVSRTTDNQGVKVTARDDSGTTEESWLIPKASVAETAQTATFTATDEFGTTTATWNKQSASVVKSGSTSTITIRDGATTTTANVNDGVSVVSAAINDQNHLILTLSDSTTVDAGDVPVAALEVAETITLDGTSTTYTLTEDIRQEDVAYILVNGLVNTDGFTISNTTPRTITLNMAAVPSGTLEIVKNTSGYIGDRMEALTTAEIEAIVSA